MHRDSEHTALHTDHVLTFISKWQQIHKFRCKQMLSEAYFESFRIPINGTSPEFVLQQSTPAAIETNPGINLGIDVNAQANSIFVDGYVHVEQATDEDDLAHDEILVNVEYLVSDKTILDNIQIVRTDAGITIYVSDSNIISNFSEEITG